MTPETKSVLNQKAFESGLEASDIQRAIVNFAITDHYQNGFPHIPMSYIFGTKSENVNFRVDATTKQSIETICHSNTTPSSYINIYSQIVLRMDINEIIKHLPTNIQLPLYYKK